MRANDWLMVTTTVAVTVLVFGLVVLCMLGRRTRRHSGYSIAMRVIFQACFTLFLPFMSYIFSQTKSKPDAGNHRRTELVILWMLLVELLRKKVSAGMAPAAEAFTRGVGRYSLLYPVEEVVRMAWIGYLIYAYVHGLGIKPFFIILWIFGVATLCKRAVCIHVAKDSFDLAKSAALVSGYMAQLVHTRRQLSNGDDTHPPGTHIMRTCNYVVMGEGRLKRKVTPYGFEIHDPEVKNFGLEICDKERENIVPEGGSPNGDQVTNTSELVRVCDIWGFSETEVIFKYDRSRKWKLENICLALALFKLLRRKMEHLHMAEVKTRQARDLVLWGLLSLTGDEDSDAHRAFLVVELELRFMDEYYQDVIPLALPRPELFLANFALSIVFVLFYGVTVLLVTSNANIIIVLGSLFKGLIGLFIAMLVHHKCFLHQVASLVVTVRTTFDIIITYLLMLTLLLVQTHQLIHYVISDWFLVSLMSNYVRKPSMQRLFHHRQIIKIILWAKHRSFAIIKVHQLNILNLNPLHLRSWVWMLVSSLLNRRLVGFPDAVVSTDVKMAIVKVLKNTLDPSSDKDFSNGICALEKHEFTQLKWACKHNMDAATMIVVWHIATALFETRNRQKHPLPPEGEAALVLSRYCAYLVAYEPGLLPDDKTWTQKVYRDIKAELNIFIQSCCTTMHRRKHLMRVCSTKEKEMSTMETGVKLGQQLEEGESGADVDTLDEGERVWKMLLEFWAELLVFVARRPSGGQDAHALALGNGGEFITHIWAMLTHAGVCVPKNHQEDHVPWCNPLQFDQKDQYPSEPV
ncbi:hypothetical protein ACQJBY_035529 [Aegilops geniculata]